MRRETKTWPGVIIMVNPDNGHQEVGGLVSKIDPLFDKKEINDLRLDALLDPCDNCKNILRIAGVDVARFSISLMDEEAMA